jgi:O-antigen ligase
VLLACAIVLATAAILVLPSVSGSNLYQKGVNRAGTLQTRQGYWQLAFPLVGDSSEHLLFGRGFNALLAGQSGGKVDSGVMSAPQLSISGTHNQYVKTLVENGIGGLALMLAWLLGTFIIAARQARLARGEPRRVSAALAGAILSFAILSLADDTFADPQSLALGALITGLAVSYGAKVRRTDS